MKKKQLTLSQMTQICIMAFGLFFGAGNLIFPPLLGRRAGEVFPIALLSFSITAIIIPVMGLIAVAKSQGLNRLALRVGPIFSVIYTSIIYLSIGPALGIPRAASMPFEMAFAPYVPNGWSIAFMRFIYTSIFFLVAYWLCINPNKIVSRMGKFLSPILLLLIFSLFIAVWLKHPNGILAPTNGYDQSPVITGFLAGYDTMDAVAALNFGLVISLAIHSFGIDNKKQMLDYSIKAGIVSGVLLLVIYSMLAYIGATTGGLFTNISNGAHILTQASLLAFGNSGPFILGAIFTLACLTTCVGLISSSSQYFATEKFKYAHWVLVWTVSSAILANTGLDWLLKFSVPVLLAIYPISILLIILGCFTSSSQKNVTTRLWSYKLTALVVIPLSIIEAMKSIDSLNSFATSILQFFPLSSSNLSWVLPGCLALIIGLYIDHRTLNTFPSQETTLS